MNESTTPIYSRRDPRDLLPLALKIEKLTGEPGKGSWYRYSSMVQMHLKAYQLWDKHIVNNPPPPNGTREREAFDIEQGAIVSYLLYSTDGEQGISDLDPLTPHSIWKHLEERHQSSSQGRIDNLTMQFHALRLRSDDLNVERHIDKIKLIARELKEIGAPITDKVLISQTLRSLGPSWKATKEALIYKDYNNFEQFRTDLKHAALRRSTDALDQFSHGSNRVDTANLADQPLECDFCGRTNHSIAHCFHAKRASKEYKAKQHKTKAESGSKPRKSSGRRRRPRKEKNEEELHIADESNPDWLFLSHHKENREGSLPADLIAYDSGATRSVTSDSNQLKNIVQTPDTHLRIFKKGSSVKAVAKGTRTLLFHDEKGNLRSITETDVLLVPNAPLDLLSARSLDAAGYHVAIGGGTCSIMKDNTTLWKSISTSLSPSSRLYLFKRARVRSSEAHCVLSATPETGNKRIDAELLHNRLGHPSAATLKATAEYFNLHCSAPPVSCATCITAKMTRAPFRTVTQEPTKPLERIHTDMVHPGTRGLNGERYFCLYTDHATRYTEVAVLRSKTEGLELLKRCISRLECIHAPARVREVQSDQGTELTASNNFRQYADERGITVRLSETGAHQSNGLSERTNRTILDISRCLLTQANLSPAYWPYAVKHSVILKNLRSTRTAPEPPAAAHLKRKPRLDSLRPFGCRAWVRIPDPKTKLHPRAQPGVFLGFAEGFKQWLVKLDSSNSIIRTRSAVFEEATFPLHLLPPERPLDFANDVPETDDKAVSCSQRPANPEHETCVPPPAIRTMQGESASTSAAGEETPPQKLSHCEPENDENKDTQSKAEGVPKAESTSKAPTLAKEPTRKSPRLHQEQILAAYKESEKQSRTMQAPTSYNQAVQSPDSEKWQASMRDEIANLKRFKAFKLVPKPLNSRPLTTTWSYRIKIDADGNPTQFKSRLCIRGFQQVEHKDFDPNSIYTSLTQLKTVRFVLAMLLLLDLPITTADIVSAYLTAELDVPIITYQTQGFRSKKNPDHVMKFTRACYGARQSGAIFDGELRLVFNELGFKTAKLDTSLYFKGYKNNKLLLAATYADDIIIAGHAKFVKALLAALQRKYELKVPQHAEWLLGIRVTTLHDEHGRNVAYHLCQEALVRKIILTAGLDGCRPKHSVLPANADLTKASETKAEDESTTRKPYRQLVGMLMYLVNGSSPHLAFATSQLARYAASPAEAHWQALLHLIRYMSVRRDHGITFSVQNCRAGQRRLRTYVDADWASCKLTQPARTALCRL